MKNIKKTLTMCVCCVLIATLAIGGTIAYLTYSDSDVNVMTHGNVSIRQNEEQRVDPAKNGTLTDADIEDFEQAKPLYPYVDENLNGVLADDYEDITFPNGKTHKLFIGDNAIDKLVSVTNTGKTDAYVRTIIALEAPTDKIDLSFNSTDWTMDKIASSHSIEVDGVKYDLFVCIYKNILKPGETTPYSLLQIALDRTATNEDSAAYGDTYDVLVLSQAVQTAGFANAATALDTGFGVVGSESAAEWFKGVEIPEFIFEPANFAPAVAEGGNINLCCDVEFGGSIAAPTMLSLFDNTLSSNGITVKNDLNIADGKYVMNNTFDYLDIRPNDESVYTFSGVKFVNEYRRKPNSNTGSDRIEAIVKHTASNDAKITFVFENCEFENAQATFSGLSGVKGEVDITFKDCTFNAMMGSDPVINIGSNLTGTVNIDHCIFNISGTYANVSVIDVSNSSTTTVTVNATNNTLNANKAVPYTYDPAKGETEADSVKIGSVSSVKNYCMFDFRLLPGGFSTINETGTILQGEVAVPSLHN